MLNSDNKITGNIKVEKIIFLKVYNDIPSFNMVNTTYVVQYLSRKILIHKK